MYVDTDNEGKIAIHDLTPFEAFIISRVELYMQMLSLCVMRTNCISCNYYLNLLIRKYLYTHDND